ncbi:MAG: cell division protein FtsQ/DivIB [Syntrophomonadaceae bacterium]
MFILLVLICTFLFLHSSFFAVEKINVTGMDNVDKDEIIKLADISFGVNIFTIDEKFVCKSVQIHPLIKSSKIIRHFPREIEIHIEERKIWALIPYQGTLLCVDDEGVCINRENYFSLTNYPVITMDELPKNVIIGQPVGESGVKLARKIWDTLNTDLQKEISQIHYQNNKGEILIYTNKGTEIRWGNEERLEEKAEYFAQMIVLEKDMQNKGNDALEYIDLRFKGQPAVKTKMQAQW